MKYSNSTFKNNIIYFFKECYKILKKLFNQIVVKLKKFSKFKFGKISGSHILVVIFLILFLLICLAFNNNRELDYPIIYNNLDGDLYLVDKKMKSSEEAIKLANGESVSNIMYANTTNRYVLFQKNESLYLYDSKEKEETTKICSNVSGYAFSEDDKYVVIIDENDNLSVYNFKETIKIESEVDNIIEVSKDMILYEKEGNLYVRSMDPKKDDRLKVTEDYDTYVHFSEDGNNILYINGERKLYQFDVIKDKEKKIANDVSTYYCDSSSCEKLYYVGLSDEKAIYYYDGKNNIKLARNIYNVNAYDVEEEIIIYSVLEDDDYTLYYKKSTNDAIVIEDGLDSIRTVKLFKDKEIYYITGDNEVKYVKITGSKLGNVKSIGEDVKGYLYLYKNGYAYVTDVDDNQNGNLYMVKNGNVKKIASNVNNSLISVSNDGKKIYYVSDYQTSGDLCVTTGSKGKVVEKDIYNYEYVKDDLIYLIKDYSLSKSKGSLYRYNGKVTKIADEVTRISSIPVYFELD